MSGRSGGDADARDDAEAVVDDATATADDAAVTAGDVEGRSDVDESADAHGRADADGSDAGESSSGGGETVAGDPAALPEDVSVLTVIVASPESRSGAVRAGLRLAKHLDAFVDSDVVKMEGEHDDQLRADVGEPFDTIPSGTAVRDAVSWAVGDPKNYSNAFVTTRLRPPEPLSSYDLVHVHNPIPLAAFVGVALRCLRAGVPYCVTTHGINNVPDFPENMEMSRPMELAFDVGFLRPYYWVLRNATHLFALSEADLERVQSTLPEQSVSIVRNGVEIDASEGEDCEEDADAWCEREFGVDPAETLLLFVGELTRVKGFDVLLEATDDLPDGCHLLAAGGAKYPELERAARDADDVTYVGYLDQDRLRRLYRRADLFVFPSRSDLFPLVNLEAMAAGTPVVSTTVGGIPEQVGSEAGVLVEPEDATALEDAVEELVRDDERRARLAAAARQRAESTFSWRESARRTVAVYDRLRRDGHV